MQALAVLISLFITIFVPVSLVLWLVNFMSTKEKCSKYGFGTYRKFKKEFHKYESWKILRHSKSGLSTITSEGGYLNIDVFSFNSMGMVMRNPFSHVLCLLFLWRQVRKRYIKKVRVKW